MTQYNVFTGDGTNWSFAGAVDARTPEGAISEHVSQNGQHEGVTYAATPASQWTTGSVGVETVTRVKVNSDREVRRRSREAAPVA